jgi:hypothetical protein
MPWPTSSAADPPPRGRSPAPVASASRRCGAQPHPPRPPRARTPSPLARHITTPPYRGHPARLPSGPSREPPPAPAPPLPSTPAARMQIPSQLWKATFLRSHSRPPELLAAHRVSHPPTRPARATPLHHKYFPPRAVGNTKATASRPTRATPLYPFISSVSPRRNRKSPRTAHLVGPPPHPRHRPASHAHNHPPWQNQPPHHIPPLV